MQTNWLLLLIEPCVLDTLRMRVQLGRMPQLGFRLSLISVFVPTTSFGILLTR